MSLIILKFEYFKDVVNGYNITKIRNSMRNTMIKMNNNINSDLYIDKVIVIFEEELENCISSKKRRNKKKK